MPSNLKPPGNRKNLVKLQLYHWASAWLVTPKPWYCFLWISRVSIFTKSLILSLFLSSRNFSPSRNSQPFPLFEEFQPFQFQFRLQFEREFHFYLSVISQQMSSQMSCLSYTVITFFFYTDIIAMFGAITILAMIGRCQCLTVVDDCFYQNTSVIH